MARWRAIAAVLVLLPVGLPVLLPYLDLLNRPQAWRAFADSPRLLLLSRNTAWLIGGTLLLALPAGTALGLLLYRTDLPEVRLLRRLLFVALFVPLPLFAAGWQAALGSGGWYAASLWNRPFPGLESTFSGEGWRPWGQGLAAVWVHALAALPWVALLVGQGLRWVERELEEDAATAARAERVLLWVTLPRCKRALAAATVWVAVQTATEISVTDMMQVRTFGEEVYTQLVLPDAGLEPDDAVARAVAVSAPQTMALFVLLAVVAGRWERQLPALDSLLQPPAPFPLGWQRWPAVGAVMLVLALVLGVPLGSLGWKLGLTGYPTEWSYETAWVHLKLVWRARQGLLAESLACAALAGGMSAAAALVLAWLIRGASAWRLGVLVLLPMAWAMPGPVVGLGLKRAIACVLQLTGSATLAEALYYGPSPLPLVWAYMVRFLPFAVALVWPTVRALPQELLDSASVDGATPGRQLLKVIWPLSAATVRRTAAAVTVLSLGELSASKLVETPGSQTYAHEVFVQMHYSVGNNLAALCLLLFGVGILGGVLVFALDAYVSSRNSSNGNSTGSPR